MKQTYHGSCHCGAVRFECDIDLGRGTSKCNCSICTKGRYWKAFVKADSFRLTQGAEILSDYRFGRNMIRHRFCSRCGIKPFGQGNMPEFGEFYGVNVACLDDVAVAELVAAPILCEDGRNDDWQSQPAETRHL